MKKIPPWFSSDAFTINHLYMLYLLTIDSKELTDCIRICKLGIFDVFCKLWTVFEHVRSIKTLKKPFQTTFSFCIPKPPKLLGRKLSQLLKLSQRGSKLQTWLYFWVLSFLGLELSYTEAKRQRVSESVKLEGTFLLAEQTWSDQRKLIPIPTNSSLLSSSNSSIKLLKYLKNLVLISAASGLLS